MTRKRKRPVVPLPDRNMLSAGEVARAFGVDPKTVTRWAKAAATHSIWSWDTRDGIWMAVTEGTQSAMTGTLGRKRQAAAKHLPSARFTMTRTNEPPEGAPDA